MYTLSVYCIEAISSHKLIRDVMAILVTVKYEEDPVKIEGARVATIQNNDFLNTQGQLTPQSEIGSS